MKDYELLGIKEGSSIDEIQRAYRVKMIAYQQLGENKTEKHEADFKKVTDAYNRLCNFEVEIEEEPHSKLRDYFYYNKEKVLIIAFVIIMIVIFVTQMNQRVTYDISIALVGNYECSLENKSVGIDVVNNINNIVKEKVYGISTPLTGYYLRSEGVIHTSQYMAEQQALTTKLSYGEIDLLILDEENYYDYLENGLLYDLDDFIKIQNDEKKVPDNLLVSGTDGKTNKEAVYGIRLAGNELIEELGLVYVKDLVACIYKDSGKKEIAFSAINVLTSDFKEIEVPESTEEAS